MSGGGDDLPHRLSDERSQRDMVTLIHWDIGMPDRRDVVNKSTLLPLTPLSLKTNENWQLRYLVSVGPCSWTAYWNVMVSINQSISQSVNQSVSQSVSQSVKIFISGNLAHRTDRGFWPPKMLLGMLAVGCTWMYPPLSDPAYAYVGLRVDAIELPNVAWKPFVGTRRFCEVNWSPLPTGRDPG